jgi:hypothetical protein
MYELFFEVAPYLEAKTAYSHDQLIDYIRQNQLVVPKLAYAKKEQGYLTLMEACWDRKSEHRPAFVDIYESISNVGHAATTNEESVPLLG